MFLFYQWLNDAAQPHSVFYSVPIPPRVQETVKSLSTYAPNMPIID